MAALHFRNPLAFFHDRVEKHVADGVVTANVWSFDVVVKPVMVRPGYDFMSTKIVIFLSCSFFSTH